MVLKGSEASSFKLYRCHSKFGLFKTQVITGYVINCMTDFTAAFTRRGGQGHIKPPVVKFTAMASILSAVWHRSFISYVMCIIPIWRKINISKPEA